jgi:hypothetical protein
MTAFLALYRGDTVAASELLALTADPGIVGEFAAQMLWQAEEFEPNPVEREPRTGRRRTLTLVSERPEQRKGE